MSTVEKAIILAQVESQFGSKRQALAVLGYLKATTIGGVSGKLVRETGKVPGTGLLLMKETGYWQQP